MFASESPVNPVRRIPRRSLAGLLLLLCGTSAAAANTGENGGTPGPPDAPAVLARVNGEPVSEAEVRRRLQAVHGDLEPHRQSPQRWQRMLEAGIDAEIRDRLLLQAAIAADLEVTPAELGAAREQTRRLLGDERFQDMLASRGSDESDFDDFLRKRLLIDKYKARLFGDIHVDESTMRTYYAGHQELFTVPRRVQLETIGLDDREVAQQIYADLKGGKDFRQSAARHTAQSESSSGVVTNRVVIEEMPENLRKMVESARPGEVLEPVEDGGRIHVIRIVDIEPAHTLTFDQAQAGLEAALLRRRQQAKLEDWYEQAREKAAIEYYPPPQRTGH